MTLHRWAILMPSLYRIVYELDALQAVADALKRLQAESATVPHDLQKPRMKINASPVIISPFEAERKPAVLDQALIEAR
jgi:hypothetical protein